VLWELDESITDHSLPLAGIRILDFSRVLAGPLCAMIAGDLGADVIKVEGPSGDPVRRLAPPVFGEDATYYLAVNRHRRNVVADLSNPEHRVLIETLLSEADGVVENFLPHQAREFGIDEWRAQFPDLVWVTVSPASRGGPLSTLPAFDLLAQAQSGLMGVTGEPDGEPMKAGSPIADVITGLYAAIGLVTGLFARARGKSARHFEAPLLESVMSALVNQAQGFLATGVEPERTGNDHPSIAPYGPVRARDGYVLLTVGTDTQFARLAELLGARELDDERFSSNAGRVRHRADIRQILDRYFGVDTVANWLPRLAEAQVPHAPIESVSSAFAQPHIASGTFVGETEAPGGRVRMMRSPLSINGQRPTIRSGPRRLGQDSELFGFSTPSPENES
jgi:crotonobetainyl-CoA:carnitine CoA-transferase CaiB-like acyl-CoA transferase